MINNDNAFAYIIDNGFNLKIAAQTSGMYKLQASINMLDWFTVAQTNLVVQRGDTATAELVDTNALANVFRFYRAVFTPTSP